MDALINVNTTVAGDRPSLPTDAGSIFVLLTTILVFFGPLFVLFPPFPPSKSDALTETHNRLGLEPARSNLKDSASPDHRPASDTAAAEGRIRSLFVYPVEPCRGVELARAKVTPAGLEFDRLFALAQLRSPFPVSSATTPDDEDARRHQWEAVALRQFPLLATVEVELWRPDLAKIKGFRDVTAGSSREVFLILRFPWRGDGLRGLWDVFAAKCSHGWRAQPTIEVMLPAAFPSEGEIADKGYEFEKVRLWGDETMALNMGCELPEELRLYLGVSNKLALFRVGPEGLREAHKPAPDSDDAGYQPVVGSQESYPVRVANLASVRDLESKVTRKEDLQKLDPRRCRANMFVSGLPPCDEDDWKTIKVKPEGSLDETTFHVSSQTTRAEREIDEGAPTAKCLGMQLMPLSEKTNSPDNFIEVGMSIEVLDRGQHVYKRK